MSDEMRETMQVLDFGMQGMRYLVEGTTFLAKEGGTVVVKSAQKASALHIQRMLKLHFASKGKYSELSIKDMEKITNGNYMMFKIPTEDPEELQQFYEALKVRKIAFAEMPDLKPGDGYVEIAYNPLDADRLRSFLEGYRFNGRKKAEETNVDDYFRNAEPGKEAELTKTAVQEAQREQKEKGMGPFDHEKKTRFVGAQADLTKNMGWESGGDNALLYIPDDHLIRRENGYLVMIRDTPYDYWVDKEEALEVEGGIVCKLNYRAGHQEMVHNHVSHEFETLDSEWIGSMIYDRFGGESAPKKMDGQMVDKSAMAAPKKGEEKESKKWKASESAKTVGKQKVQDNQRNITILQPRWEAVESKLETPDSIKYQMDEEDLEVLEEMIRSTPNGYFVTVDDKLILQQLGHKGMVRVKLPYEREQVVFSDIKKLPNAGVYAIGIRADKNYAVLPYDPSDPDRLQLGGKQATGKEIFDKYFETTIVEEKRQKIEALTKIKELKQKR